MSLRAFLAPSSADCSISFAISSLVTRLLLLLDIA
jgi:hypothetical protein